MFMEGMKVKSLAAKLLDWEADPFPERGSLHPRAFPSSIKERWDEICRDAAASRRLPELHEARADFLSVFDQLIKFHESHLELLDLQNQLTGRNGFPRQPREELQRALDELKRLRDDIFSNWQSVDDLTRILIDKFSLSADKLREVAAKHPPPESWLNETADPFSAD
jgi:hypothetical protein